MCLQKGYFYTTFPLTVAQEIHNSCSILLTNSKNFNIRKTTVFHEWVLYANCYEKRPYFTQKIKDYPGHHENFIFGLFFFLVKLEKGEKKRKTVEQQRKTVEK